MNRHISFFRKRWLTAMIFALAFAAGGILPAGPLRAQSYDPIAEIQAKLDKAIEEKGKVDGAISAIKPNITVLEKNQTELEATRDRLTNLKQKLRAIQLWNAFVGVIGVSMDALSKVNPGSSAVIATANFIQDRAVDYLKSKDRGNQLTMRIRNLSETASRLSPRVRMVERRIAMTPQQVADELVSRGMVQNDWLQRWTNTPDVVAQSDSVITGKITFIQEELGPAIAEVENLISETRELIQDLYRELSGLEKDARSLDEAIRDWQRQLEMQGVMKEANKPPQAPPPNPIPNPYVVSSSMDYGAAASEMKTAWSDLKARTIDGSTYQSRCQVAYYGALIKMSENLRPVSESYSAVSNWFWNQGGWKTEAGWARLAAASAAYSAACNRESQAFQASVIETQKALAQEREAEQKRYADFSRRMDEWNKTPLTVRYSYWGYEEMNYNTTLGQAGYTGESLAWSAWAGAPLMDRLLDWTQSMPVGPLKGAKERYGEWQKQVREAMEKQQRIFGNMKTDDNAFSGLASEAPGLASALEPNIEVWMYAGSWSWSGSWWGDLRELHRRLKTYQVTFNALAKAQRAKADEVNLEFNALDRKCSAAVSAIGGADAALKAAVLSIETKLKTFQASRGQLDASGTTLRSYLSFYGASRSGIKDLEDLLKQINTPEKLEAHCLSLLPGEQEYNPSWKAIPNAESLEQMRIRYRSMAAKIISDRQDYTDAYRQTEQTRKDLDNTLEKMRGQFREIEPAQVSFLNTEGVLLEVERDAGLADMDRYYLRAWTPDDPGEFPDPNYGLQELMDRHRELAGQYHALVDPALAKIRAEGRPEARRIQKLVEKIDAEGPGWMGLPSEEFSTRINAISYEGYTIYISLAGHGSAPPESAVAQAYSRLMTRTMNLSSAYYLKQRLVNAAAELDSHIAGARNFLSQPESYGGRSGAEGWIGSLDGDLREKGSLKDSPEIASRLASAAEVIASLKAYLSRDDDARKQKVTAFYADFRQAYESRNDSAVVSFMSSDWSADDGTSLADLQGHFRRIFSLYDEVRYNIQNMNVTKTPAGSYQVTYDVTITSRIYRRNIKREEKSSVSEEVVFDAGGKARIARTLSGRFWYVQ